MLKQILAKYNLEQIMNNNPKTIFIDEYDNFIGYSTSFISNICANKTNYKLHNKRITSTGNYKIIYNNNLIVLKNNIDTTQILSDTILTKGVNFHLEDLSGPIKYDAALTSCKKLSKCIGIYTFNEIDYYLSSTNTKTYYPGGKSILIHDMSNVTIPNLTCNSNYGLTTCYGESINYQNADISHAVTFRTASSENYFVWVSPHSYIKPVDPSFGCLPGTDGWICDFEKKLYNKYLWNIINIYPLFNDHWPDTKTGWSIDQSTNPNGIDDQLSSYSFGWKFLQGLSGHIFKGNNIAKLLIGGWSNGAAFTSRLLEDHARWQYKDGSGAYIDWLYNVDVSNIASIHITGGSNHCYANNKGSTIQYRPDSYFIHNDSFCNNCDNKNAREATNSDNNCDKLNPRSCYFCCPMYTEQTYMNNSKITHPPVITYQYAPGKCNNNNCISYNSKYMIGIKNNIMNIDNNADTCASIKYVTIVNNSQSRAIGISDLSNYADNSGNPVPLAPNNRIAQSHMYFPYIASENSNNSYSILKWLHDISFIQK